MAQNTNAVAYTRLRPLENTNVGQIVEEHVRYWKKTKDENRARQLAQKAKEKEFARKINNDTFEIYDGLQPEENAGFLNSQIVDRFEENKPFYMELAKKAASGDTNARLRLADEKKKIEAAVGVNKVWAEKIRELEKQKSEGTYNELLDSDIEKFKNSILSGKYKLNPDWSLDIYSPSMDQAVRESLGNVSEDGIVRLDSSSLYNNDFLNTSYHKKPQFVANGEKIADNLLDTENGNKLIGPSTKRDGIKLVKGLFAEDSIEARSFYREAQQKGITSFGKPLGELDQIEQNILAERYYEQYVAPNIQEVDNSLANTARSLDNQKKVQDIRKRNREEEESKTTVSLSTNSSDGSEVVLSSITTAKGALATEKATVFNLGGKEITTGVEGKSGSNKTFSSLGKTADGKIIAIGQETIKTNVPVFNEDGTPQIQEDGDTVMRVQEVTQDVIEEDPKVLNNIARKIEDENGKKMKNLSELSTFLDKKKEEVIKPTREQARFTINEAEQLAEEGDSLVQEGEQSIEDGRQITKDVAQSAKELRDAEARAKELIEKYRVR